ncbi:MAG: hypothetical protein AB7Q17_11520 [Phycisphaerae bacterium]
MNRVRVLFAGIVGGIVMFCFGAAAHMVLHVDHLYVRPLPADSPVTSQLKSTLTERGFYFFPGMDESSLTDEETERWMAQLRAGPRGIVVFDPSGGEMMEPRQLGNEFASNVAAALALAIVLANVRANWLGRTFLAGLVGVFATLSIDVSYWNWYRFPDGLLAASLIEQGLGWLLAGAFIAAVLGRAKATPPVGNL